MPSRRLEISLLFTLLWAQNCYLTPSSKWFVLSFASGFNGLFIHWLSVNYATIRNFGHFCLTWLGIISRFTAFLLFGSKLYCTRTLEPNPVASSPFMVHGRRSGRSVKTSLKFDLAPRVKMKPVLLSFIIEVPVLLDNWVTLGSSSQSYHYSYKYVPE